MNWKLPNQLTVARIVLAGIFFMLLGFYDPSAWWGKWLLNAAFGLYIIAAITDILDGYLARKMNITSAFGRIADPFVDKVLVVGAFAMMTGSNFTMPAGTPEAERLSHWLTGNMISSVQAWMLVVIMAREFIVSAVRGYSESQGIKFPATPAGKIKMLVQSVAICACLYQMANLQGVPWAVYLKVGMMWLAVVVTLISGVFYIEKAKHLLTSGEEVADRHNAAAKAVPSGQPGPVAMGSQAATKDHAEAQSRTTLKEEDKS